MNDKPRSGRLATPDGFMGPESWYIYYDADTGDFFPSKKGPTDAHMLAMTYYVYVTTVRPVDDVHLERLLVDIENFHRKYNPNLPKFEL